MKKNMLVVSLFLTACAVGPDYVRPTAPVSAQFKEAPSGWKVATPRDVQNRGAWWQLFHDDTLNQLELALGNADQNIVAAAARYEQACAVLEEARANYFPILSGSVTGTRQRTVSLSTTTTTTTNNSTTRRTNNSHVSELTASWELDIWGKIRRNVEANRALAQASAAQLAAIRLSEQALLAQLYFQIRALDSDQHLLDETVGANRKTLQLVKNRYQAGVVGYPDVVQAQAQLETAQAQAAHNGVNRSQFEHAVAILIGKPPADFSLPPKLLNKKPPVIPLSLPSSLLERRPDIAAAERQMAAANAQIGEAIAAYFPDFSLSAAGTAERIGFAHWFSLQSFGWSASAAVAETIFDAGARAAKTKQARAQYEEAVATYRQTVLSAFQEVEDNLVAVRLLAREASLQNQAANHARKSLQLAINQYEAGTISYSDVIVAQTVALAAEKNAIDVRGLQMTATVGLIKALGGSF